MYEAIKFVLNLLYFLMSIQTLETNFNILSKKIKKNQKTKAIQENIFLFLIFVYIWGKIFFQWKIQVNFFYFFTFGLLETKIFFYFYIFWLKLQIKILKIIACKNFLRRPVQKLKFLIFLKIQCKTKKIASKKKLKINFFCIEFSKKWGSRDFSIPELKNILRAIIFFIFICNFNQNI